MMPANTTWFEPKFYDGLITYSFSQKFSEKHKGILMRSYVQEL